MSETAVVIFDMYNTLVENEPHQWDVTFGEIIQTQGLDVTLEVFRDQWRVDEKQFQIRRIVPGAAFESYYEGWCESYVRTFAALRLVGDAAAASRRTIHDLGTRMPYEDTVAGLKNIKEQWRIALLSNADDDYLNPALVQLGVKFEDVLSSEMAQCYKPDAELFHEMLRRLDVIPAQAVYVGDRQFEDVKGAKEVGMRTVWINRFGNVLDPELPAPDIVVASLLEIPALLSQ